MEEYPMELIDFLHAHRMKIGELEDLLDESWESGIDPANDTAEHSLNLFLSDAFPDVPLDEIHRFSQHPEVIRWFSIVYEAKKKELHSSDIGRRRPRFILPSRLITDIRMEKTYDSMIATPLEWGDVFTPPHIRKGQLELLQSLFSSDKRNKIMKAPTGLGKTFVLLAYATGKPSIIVEPDRGLQLQMRDRYGATILMGRNNYQCRDHHVSADITPCRFKASGTGTCSDGCPWYDAYNRAIIALKAGKPVVTNSWNMWQFFRNIHLVIFDEFHKILNELTVRYEIPEDVSEDTGMEYLLTTNHDLAEKSLSLWQQLADDPENSEKAREYNRLINRIQALTLFIESYGGTYIYEDHGRKYIKLDKVSTMKYIAEGFNFDKVFVSATPVHIPDADLIVTNESVTKVENAPIVYYPVARMTSKQLQTNPEYLEYAARVINMLFRHYTDHGLTEKIIIHTGNTTTHMEIAQYLEMSCLKHTKGELKETMETFRKGNYQALLIASADAGYDFHGSRFGLQFILKVPYPTRNMEWTAMREKFGQVYEKNAYTRETVTQIVQATGRISRGADDLGMSVILDSKFLDLWNYNREMFPDDFTNRLIDLSGELRKVASRQSIDYYGKGGME